MRDRHLRWPDLVIATHPAVDQGCVFDQLTQFWQGRI